MAGNPSKRQEIAFSLAKTTKTKAKKKTKKDPRKKKQPGYKAQHGRLYDVYGLEFRISGPGIFVGFLKFSEMSANLQLARNEKRKRSIT